MPFQTLVATIHFSPFTCCFRRFIRRSFTFSNSHNHSYLHYSICTFMGEWFTNHSNHIHTFTPITRIAATKSQTRTQLPKTSIPAALNRSFKSQIAARYAAFWHAVPQIALASFLYSAPKSQRFESQRLQDTANASAYKSQRFSAAKLVALRTHYVKGFRPDFSRTLTRFHGIWFKTVLPPERPTPFNRHQMVSRRSL